MGAMIAATVILLVLGASMGLLFAYLDGVDEYNHQAARVSEKQQDAVQENIVLSATLSQGRTYDLNIKNPGSRPAEIIEIRTVHPDGTITVLGDDARMRLEGFSDATLDYVVPDGIESAQLVAITSAGNTFGAEINIAQTKTQGPGDAGSATVNGMGLNSRLADKEYSGHTLYGSYLWGSEESLKPYTAIGADEAPDPPQFAAIILDTDTEKTWQITDYNHNDLFTLNSDGTMSSTPKPNILEYTKVRGDAQVSSDSGGITVVPGAGTQGALLKLDPKIFGQKLLFDVGVGTGSVEILTSPYGSLADDITVPELKEECSGATWRIYKLGPRYSERLAATSIYTSNWIFDPVGLDVFLIHKQAVTPSLIESTTTYEKTTSSELRHIHSRYWSSNHYAIQSTDSHHIAPGDDHAYHLEPNLYNDRHRYYDHPGSYTLTYDTQAISFQDRNLLLRDGTKFFVAYEQMMNLALNISQLDHPAHGIHRINDDEPVRIGKYLSNSHFNGVFYTGSFYHSPPHAIVQADSEPKFDTTYRPNHLYPRSDMLYGLPIVSYMGGADTNDDYVDLDGVTINGIDQRLYERLHRYDYPPPSEVDLCIFAQTPYKVHQTIESDTPHLRVAMPDRVEPYAEHLYIRVHPGDSAVTLKAVASESIAGAGHAPYRILEDSKTLHAGSASPEGIIDFIEGLPESFVLSVYPESMLYRGSFSTIVFDPHSGESFRIPGPDERVYTVHTWVQVPIVGDVVVTDLRVLDKEGAEVRLAYLEGAYTASQDDDGRVWVPVIPGYYSIHMKINGVDAVLRYSDVLGASNVKIIAPSSNTVSKASDAPITVIEASAGSVAYAIATSDGTMSAIIQGTVSGTAYIDHGYIQDRRLVTCNRDPLSGWFQVYKNGELYRSGYDFVDYEPQISTEHYEDGQIRHVKTTFTYDKHLIHETTTIPVQTGDFIEFYLHSKIFAESAVPVPRNPNVCGWITVFAHQSSHASATANIHDGSIIIG